MSATTDARPAAAAQLPLAGRTALVTGAGRGLGRGLAEALAAAGADVALMSRTRAELQVVAEAVRAHGRRAWAAACDVTDARAVRAALDELPAPDVLVSNAGANAPQPFLDVEQETYDRLFGLNVRAAFFVAQDVARRMVARGQGGAIVHVTSQMGHVGAANRTVYCATKHALEGLTKALAVELGPHGIRVNAVAPTYVETPMTASYLADEAFRQDALRRIPLGRVGRVEDVTGAVVFLASPAAALITGASLLVDGGYTAQ